MNKTVPKGYSFCDGMLGINVGMTKLTMRFLPHPVAEEPDYKGDWIEAWPTLRLIAPPDAVPVNTGSESVNEKRGLFRDFGETVPSDLRSLVEPFQTHQWPLLKFAATNQRMLDLLLANPVLAYALANSFEFRHSSAAVTARQVPYRLKDKQRDILEWLGFGGTQAMVKLFSRIRKDDIIPAMLRRLMLDPVRLAQVIDRLSQLESVNSEVITFVTHPALCDLPSQSLLRELSEAPADTGVSSQLINALYIREQLGMERGIAEFHAIRRIIDYCAESDRLYVNFQQENERAMEAAAQRRLEIEGQAPAPVRRRRRRPAPAEPVQPVVRRRAHPVAYPPPPVPGYEDDIGIITPIADRRELNEEGYSMRNCVASYYKNVTSGNTYIYHVAMKDKSGSGTLTEHYTLAIRPVGSGSWRRNQMKAPCNNPAKPAAVAFVDLWLARNRPGI